MNLNLSKYFCLSILVKRIGAPEIIIPETLLIIDSFNSFNLIISFDIFSSSNLFEK